VCYNLAAGSPNGSSGSPAPLSPDLVAATPAAAVAPAPAVAPTPVADALMAAQLRVMTQKAAAFERAVKELEVEHDRMKEQVRRDANRAAALGYLPVLLLLLIASLDDALNTAQYLNPRLHARAPAAQLATLEFEKTELGQMDEFEREARLFAEDQLAEARGEVAALSLKVGAGGGRLALIAFMSKSACSTPHSTQKPC
jgi:hypothetical protein